MATVLLPRSLVEMFAGAPRRLDLDAADGRGRHRRPRRPLAGHVRPPLRAGTRIRPFINVFVDGQRAELATRRRPAARSCTSSPPSRVAALRCADGRQPPVADLGVRGIAP